MSLALYIQKPVCPTCRHSGKSFYIGEIKQDHFNLCAIPELNIHIWEDLEQYIIDTGVLIMDKHSNRYLLEELRKMRRR